MLSVLRLQSSIADSYRSYIRLWYFCRAIDTTGCGIVELDTETAAAELGVSKRTIVNYIQQGKNLYRHITKLSPGRYKLYLKSLITIAADRGLDSFGVVAEVSIAQLRNIKITATEIEAIGRQNSSKHAAKFDGTKSNKPGDCKPKKRKSRHLLKPERMFEGTGLIEQMSEDKPASQLCPGALVYDSKHSTLFVAHTFNQYGISQQYIADKMLRNRRTINRRLKNTTKLQLAKYEPSNFVEREILAEENNPQSGRFIKISRSLNVAPNLRGLTFKLLTNIYYPQYDLCSMRASRRDLKTLIKNYETA